MSFNFRLQKILDYKIKIEEEKKNKLGEIVSLYNKLKVEIDNVLLLKEEITKKLEVNFDINYLTWASKSIQGIYQTIKNNKEKMAELEKKIEKARNEYIEARKERTLLEKIREKRYAEYQEELKRKERKILEEISIKMWSDKAIKEFEWT